MNFEFAIYIPTGYDSDIRMNVINQVIDKMKDVFVYSMTFEKVEDRIYLLKINYRDDKADIKIGDLK